MLPPRMPHTKIYGQLILKISRPRWNIVTDRCRAKIKFWGQQNPTNIIMSQSASISYDVVVPLDRLQSYLVDMKVLKIDLEDYRNGKVLASGVLNFLMYPMEKDKLLIQECVELLYSKKKYGQMDVSIEFKINDQDKNREVLLSEMRNIENSQMVNRDNRMSNREQKALQPDQRQQKEPIYQPTQKAHQLSHQAPHETTKLKKSPPNPYLNQLVHILNEHCCQRTAFLRRQNFQAQIEKLRLDSLQLLQELPAPSATQTMSIVIDCCQKMGGIQPADYHLTMQMPILVNSSIRLNMYDIASRACRNTIIDFCQVIQLNMADGETDDKILRKYLAQSAKFTLGVRNSAPKIAQTSIKLSALLTGLAAEILRLQMKGRKAGMAKYTLVLKRADTKKEVKDKLQIIQNSPVATAPPAPLPPPCSTHLLLQVNSYHNLQPHMFRDNNYILRVKYGNKSHSSPTVWASHSPVFFYSVLLPAGQVSPILVELWNRTSNDSLIGICKIDIPELRQSTSLYPTVLLDGECSVSSLKNVTMGYLQMVMLAGDPEQINRYSGRHKQKSIFSAKPSNINQETSINEKHAGNSNKQPKKNMEGEHERQEGYEIHPPQPEEQHEQPHRIPEQPHERPQEVPHQQPSITSSATEPQEPKSLLQLLYHLFFSLLKSPHILESLRPTMPILEFRDLIHQYCPLSQLSIGKISMFFVDNVRINAQQVTKSFQAFENYQGILSEQFTEILKQLKQAMEYEGLSINMLEIKLSIDGQAITTETFKKTLQQELPSFNIISQEVICRMLPNPINVGEFSDYIRKLDLFEQVGRLNTGAQAMKEFIGDEFRQIIENEQDGLLKVYNNQTFPTKMDHKEVMKAFLLVNINISYWEALNILEFIGDDSRQAFFDWIRELLVDPPTKMIRSPTFGQATFRPELREANEVVESSLPSPIHAPAISIQFNIGLSASNLFINGRNVQFRQISECVLEIRQKIEEYFQVEVDTEDGTLFGEGMPGQWVAVMDEQQNYIGAMIIK